MELPDVHEKSCTKRNLQIAARTERAIIHNKPIRHTIENYILKLYLNMCFIEAYYVYIGLHSKFKFYQEQPEENTHRLGGRTRHSGGEPAQRWAARHSF